MSEVARQEEQKGGVTSAPSPLIQKSTTSPAEVKREESRPVAIPQSKSTNGVIGVKEITVFATRSFKVLPKEIQGETRTRISAFSLGNGYAFRSLSEEELKEVDKEVIGLSYSDPNFGRAVDAFFNNYSIVVPYEEGYKITVPVNASGDVVWDPKFVRQIMAYRHVMNSPRVAKTYAEVQDFDINYYYAYIEDKEAIKLDSVLAKEARKMASKNYLELTTKGNEDKRDWICQIARRGIKVADPKQPQSGYIPTALFAAVRVDDLDNDDKELALEEFMNKYPIQFNELVSDPDLEWKALLEQLVAYNIFRREGNVIMYDRDAIGANDEEAIARMKTSEFSQTLVVVKNQLRNAQGRTKKVLA